MALAPETDSPTKEASPMRSALQFTISVIERRSQQYRNMVIGVCVVLFGSLLTGLIAWSWRPLMGLLLIIPLGSAFFTRDAYLVYQWQHRLLAWWEDGALDLAIFTQAMRQAGHLPKNTIQGMMETLPASVLGRTENTGMRRALALTLQALNQCRQDHQRRTLGVLTLGVVLPTMALLLESWLPLLGFIALGLIEGGYRWHRTAILRRWRQALDRLEQTQTLDLQRVADQAGRLDWEGIPSTVKDKVLAMLVTNPAPV